MNKRRFSKLLAILAAISLFCGTVLVPISVFADGEEENDIVWSLDFDSRPDWELVSGSAPSYVEAGGGYALNFGNESSNVSFRLPDAVPKNPGKGTYKLAYEWESLCLSDFTSKSTLMLYNEGIKFYELGWNAGMPYAMGAAVPDGAFLANTRYSAEITIDFSGPSADVRILDPDKNEVYSANNIGIPNLTALTAVRFLSDNNGMTVDNLVLYCIDDGEEPEKPGPEEFEDVIWEQDFDGFKKEDSGKINLGGENTDALEINPTGFASPANMNVTGNKRHAYLSTHGSGYALTMTHTAWTTAGISVDSAVPVTSGTGRYRLTYDWYITCNTGAGEYGAVKFMSGGSYYAVGTRSRYPSGFGPSSPAVLAGEPALKNNTWYKAELLMDFEKKRADYTLYSDDEVVYTLLDNSIPDLTSLTGLGFDCIACGTSIDNIRITRIYNGTEEPFVKAGNIKIHDTLGELQTDFGALSPYTSDIEINFYAVMDPSSLTSKSITVTKKSTGESVPLEVTPGITKVYLKIAEGAELDDASIYVLNISPSCAAKNGKTVDPFTLDLTVAELAVTAGADTVKINGSEVSGFESIKSSGTYDIEISYRNTTAEDVVFYVLAGYYSADNELVKHSIYRIEKDAHVIKDTIVLTNTDPIPGNAVKLKLMTWKAFDENELLAPGLILE